MSPEVIKKLRMQSGQHILILNPPEECSMSARRERLSTNQKITIDPSRSVEIPEDFQAFLNGKPVVKAFFEGLAYTNRKEYVRCLLPLVFPFYNEKMLK